MIKANGFRSSIRRHGTSNRKFSHSNRFILQKNSPACTTDAVLRKYGDTSARCTSFGPYFNNRNQNPFYIELAQAENYYGERLRNQASCSDPSDLVKHLGPFISSVTNCICVYSDIKLIQVGEKIVLE
jgi:transposase-like protein